MFNITVFSKNRPAQLDLFLESMQSSWNHQNIVNVIYKSTTPKFEQGYELVKCYHPSINFIPEVNFKDDVLSTILIDNEYSVFFVDDDVWINDFELDSRFNTFTQNTDILCLSLRLCPRLTNCYPVGNLKQLLPPINITKDELITWGWKNTSFDWGYPMSLDGHIFRTKQILPLLKHLHYNNPNSLESNLAGYPINKPLMACYRESAIFNNPCNKVQTWNNNLSGSVNIEEINELFLSGKRLDKNAYFKFKNNGCHQEVELKFV